MLFSNPSIVSLLFLVLVTSTVNAQPLKSEQVPTETVAASVASTILSRLKKARPDLQFTDLEPSPMNGVYRVKINGQLAFVGADGSHLIAGEMFEVRENSLVNLQEQERREAEVAFEPERAKLLAAVNTDDLLIFSPESNIKGHVYVFTDIDCGFCRKLHSQMEAFMAKGIEVRYLAFPRAGVNSMSAQKLATAWCADNPQDAMTKFKRGENVKIATCDKNPVADQYMLGQQVGVAGTPAIVLESGKLIPGAVSPEYLAKEMGI